MEKKDSDASTQVRAYLASQPAGARRELRKLRGIIKAIAPDAAESFSYGIPGFKLDGRQLVYYAGWKTHASIYPITGAIQRTHAAALKGYEMSKGTVRFPLSEPLPVTLVTRLVKARVKELRKP